MQVRTHCPKKNGVYVCYVDLPFETKFLEKKLLFYYDGTWCYLGSDQTFRGEVHCWIGPLPSPTKEDLTKDNDIRYAIGTKNQVKNRAFSNGPFETLTEATECIGFDGDFIIKIDPTDFKCIPIRKWSNNKNGWVSKKKK